MAGAAGKESGRKKKDAKTERAAAIDALHVGSTRNAWSRAKLSMFFEHLAATANVRAAARKAGMDSSRIYQRRRADPAFAALWEGALADGIAALEAGVLAAALHGSEVDGEARIDTATAMKVVAWHDARQKRQAPPQVACMPIDEVERILLKRLDAVEKRLRAKQ